MKRILRLVCLIWLVSGLPIFGIMPLAYIVLKNRLPNEVVWIWWAILRIFWTILWTDPEPGTEHIPPPFGVEGYWAMVGASSGISILLIYGLKRRRAREAKTNIQREKRNHNGEA